MVMLRLDLFHYDDNDGCDTNMMMVMLRLDLFHGDDNDGCDSNMMNL